MAANTNTFTDKETNNWFKACIALNVTKEGLTNFVENTMKKVHAAIGSSCGQCSIEKLMPCPTRGLCAKKQNSCSFHKSNLSQQCQICDKVKRGIILYHRFSGPSWKNTKAQFWIADWWQIAKCYLPPDGYAEVSSIQESDFNAVINIMLNCTEFLTYLDPSWLSPPPPDPQCPLEKIRQIGRDVRHSATCKTTEAELQDYFPALTKLLTDSIFLGKDPIATIALNKLTDLQNDRLPLSELGNLIQGAIQSIGRIKEAAEEQFSEKAKHTLEEGLNKIMEALGDGEKEIEKKIQQSDREITEKLTQVTSQIEQMKNDSIQTLYDRTEYCTRQIEQKIGEEIKKAENIITTLTKSSAQLIEKSVDRIQQNAPNQAKEDYERDAEDFLRRLVDHYRDTVSYLPLSALNPSLDKPIQDVYVSPKIHRIQIENDGKRTKQEQIFRYQDCFKRGDNLLRRIYLQGEPGSGKSAFASTVVHEWCNIHLPSNESTREKHILHTFKFLFFISLPDSIHQKDVMQMIQTQIIDKIYMEDEREEGRNLCIQIMKNEICLVIQDGLDEWPCDEALPSMPGIHKVNCSVLTTSRPWKLADERIRNSQIDMLLEVEGINDPKAFTERILRCLLDESNDVEESMKQFKKFLKSRSLESISSSPMLLALVLCTWVDGIAERLTGSSLCDLYTTMLDCLCKKASPDMCYFNKLNPPPVKQFYGTQYIQQNKDHIDSIAKAAFSFLLSNEKETSIVFSDVKLSDFLLAPAKAFALKSGLLSKRKAKRVTDTTCRFIHKTMQEFLSAYHIANNPDVIDDVILEYLQRCDNSNLDISQIFIFLCGLNISAANKLSALMNELDADNKFHKVRNYHPRTFQDCILSGYREAFANKNTPIHLHLSNFSIEDDNVEDLSHIFALNTLRAQSVYVHAHLSIVSEDGLSTRQGPGPVSLTARDDPGPFTRDDQEEVRVSDSCRVFDFSWCHNLEKLMLVCNATVLSNALVGLKKLKDLQLCNNCKCEALDLSHHVYIESITLGSGVTLLPLSINNYKTLKRIDIRTTYDGLDLSMFENLNSITISNKVKVLPKQPLIHYKQKITCIGVCNMNFDLKGFDNKASYTWCLLNGADPLQCADYTPVMPSIERINLHGVTCSSTWLGSLLSTLLTLDHWVRCELQCCTIISTDHEFKSRLSGDHIASSVEDVGIKQFGYTIIYTDLNNTCIVEAKFIVYLNFLRECLYGLNVKNLSLLNNNFDTLRYQEPPSSHSLASLSQLETLKVDLPEYIDLQLPASLKHLTVSYNRLSPSELRDLLNRMSAWAQSIECSFEFLCVVEIDRNRIDKKIPPEEYIPIKQEIETRVDVKVKGFQIYDFTKRTSTWSLRDSVGVNVAFDDDFKLFLRLPNIEDVDGLSRISMQLQIKRA